MKVYAPEGVPYSSATFDLYRVMLNELQYYEKAFLFGIYAA